jgi:V/A-type H+-transporting ATPase subunit E
MQNKLQELTDKLYREGLSKGTAEAEQVLAKAKAEAQQIIEQAKKEAEQIVAHAKSSSAEVAKNTDSELKMAARQTLNSVKQQVEEAIAAKAITPSLNAAFASPEFIQSIVKEAVAKFNPSNDEGNALTVLLPKEKQEELQQYFFTKAGEALSVYLDVQFSKGVKSGFKIAPKEGGYQISFTEQDFENLFKSFLRPRLVELLFGGK